MVMRSEFGTYIGGKFVEFDVRNEKVSALQQGQSVIGTVTQVYEDFVDVLATNNDGSQYVVRQVYPVIGYSVVRVGDQVTVRGTGTGINECEVVGGLQSLSGENIFIGPKAYAGKGSTFLGRVTRVYTIRNSITSQNPRGEIGRMEVQPLDGSPVFVSAFATSATSDVRVGDIVTIQRSEGGSITGASYSYNNRYVAISKMLPDDEYDRTSGGRSVDATGEFGHVTNIGIVSDEILPDVQIRARGLEIRWGTLIWGTRSNISPARRLTLDPTIPQIITYANPEGSEIEVDVQDAEIWVTQERRSDKVDVKGGIESSHKDDIDVPYMVGVTDDVSWTTNRSRWNVKLARSVSVFEINISNPAYKKSTTYVIILERNHPYDTSGRS